jgi:hypothetical protein
MDPSSHGIGRGTHFLSLAAKEPHMTRFVLAAVAGITMLSGFAYAQSPATPSKMHGHSGSSMAECPMGVPGAQVSTANTTTGEALTFVTNTPAEVAELRRRVHAAAEMHNKNHASSSCGDMKGDETMGGMMGSDHMKGGTMMPQSRATVADVDKGACMTMTPSTAADLEELRSAINVRAARMQQHGCGPMAQK